MNDTNNKNNTTSGLGFCSILTLILIVCSVIKWGGLWVLSPMCIGLILGAIVVIVYVWLIS